MEGFVDWLFGWSREYQRRVPNGVSARDVAFVFVLYETDNECIQYDCVLVTVRTANVWFSRPPRNSVVTTVRFIPEMGSGGVEPPPRLCLAILDVIHNAKPRTKSRTSQDHI